MTESADFLPGQLSRWPGFWDHVVAQVKGGRLGLLDKVESKVGYFEIQGEDGKRESAGEGKVGIGVGGFEGWEEVGLDGEGESHQS